MSKTHVSVGLLNPYLICSNCREPVKYWHDPDRCNCGEVLYNIPCGHTSVLISKCPTWTTAFGCKCEDKEVHNKD